MYVVLKKSMGFLGFRKFIYGDIFYIGKNNHIFKIISKGYKTNSMKSQIYLYIKRCIAWNLNKFIYL